MTDEEKDKYKVLKVFVGPDGKKVTKSHKPRLYRREAEFLRAGGFIDIDPVALPPTDVNE